MNREIKYEQPSKLFNEAEWLRLLFLISDTIAWIQEMEKNVLYQLPVADKSKLFRKTYYLPATSLAHLLEKHYYKIARHPGCGKFAIDQPQSISGSLNFKRCMDTGTVIGYNREGESTTFITVITDGGGTIKTAFPGVIPFRHMMAFFSGNVSLSGPNLNLISFRNDELSILNRKIPKQEL
jgi:hypothetical protein